MPGKPVWRGTPLLHSVFSQKVMEFVLDERVEHVLQLINYADQSGIPEGAEEKILDRQEDRALLRQAVSESVVLMKNEDKVLPFDKSKPILVIGPNAKATAYCGGGSAALPPYYAVSPFEGVSAQSEGEVTFSQGAFSHVELPLLGPLLKTTDGKPGFTFTAFADPPEHSIREPVDQVHLLSSMSVLSDYKNPKINSFTWYADMEGYFTPDKDGIYDFGVAVAGTGRLFVDDDLVVDNTKDQRPGPGFFGIGTIEEKGSKQLKAGKAYKVLFQFGTAPTSSLPIPYHTFGPGAFRFGCCIRLDPDELISDAAKLASKVEQVVIFGGLNSDWEKEGHDRVDMDLPPGSDKLISEVLKANPRAAIVIQSGTPVSMPWISSASALLQAWYGGNETGNGIADVLYGKV